MNLLHIFSKRAKEQQPQESQGGSGAGDAAIYSGMRVEVSTFGKTVWDTGEQSGTASVF